MSAQDARLVSPRMDVVGPNQVYVRRRFVLAGLLLVVGVAAMGTVGSWPAADRIVWAVILAVFVVVGATASATLGIARLWATRDDGQR